ncbi:MAG TPA: phytoene desaturase family protein [Abditibacteriaceae bacterium]|nr:phytoene desaturase family protein [Abditibacteriaceae bacterium]
MSKRVAIIGGGIGGLATACLLGKKGYKVQLFEKNEQLGGVCNSFQADGFTFDMGPSWYLMPDVFESFFSLLGEKVEDHLDLIKLSPSYRIYFKDTGKQYDFYSDLSRDLDTIEALEPGAGAKLQEYLQLSAMQYKIAIAGFMYKNYDTIFDFFNKETAVEGRKLEVFSKMSDYVEKFFKTDEVQKIMEYQLVFLGSSPYNTPALYNIMSHIDFNMGVYYPRGGIYQIVRALQRIGTKHGVEYYTGAPAERILTGRRRVRGVRLASGKEYSADIVVSNANIHHTETKLLSPPHRSYSDRYWKTRTLAPSAFILYLGLKDKVPGLAHHNLVFAKDWRANFAEIFDAPQWPSDPSFYVCAPSVTDPDVAPPGQENLFVLVPTAPGIEATPEQLERYAEKILDTMAREMKIFNLRQRICYQRLFWAKDFTERYNNLKGSALGLAHTMNQTAILRPNNKSKKLSGLFYVGANTNPGIGMPICLISAELAYKRIVGDKSASHLEEL